MAAILGGGLGGLSTAYYLIKNNVVNNNNLKLMLFEATARCGGWIQTIKANDYVFEQGPRTIRPKGPRGVNTLNMMQELGLSEHVTPITSDHPAAKNRMIYANKSLHALPSSLKSVFSKNEPFSKPLVYALFRDLVQQPRVGLTDESIYDFVARRFGKEIADYAVAPMICGICAGDAKEISVKFLMKSLFEYEQNHGGVVKGLVKSYFQSQSNEVYVPLSELATRAQKEKWNVYTLKGGLETFPSSLVNHLKENSLNVRCNTKIEKLNFIDSNTAEIKANDDVWKVNHVYSTIPAFKLASLVENQHPELADELKQIPFVTVGLVNLYFSAKDLIPAAFGFLVPPIENSPILGVVFDSCCLPDQNGTVLTVMLGGKWFVEKFGENVTEPELFNIALKEVEKILNIKDTPTEYNVKILNKCIPQYIVGHYEKVAKVREYIKDNNLPLSLVGCSYDGVGINDVIYSAKTQVEELPDFQKYSLDTDETRAAVV